MSSSRRDVMKLYLAKKYDKMLDSVLAAEMTLSGTESKTRELEAESTQNNRKIIKQIAGSLVHASVEKLRPSLPDNVEDTQGYELDSALSWHRQGTAETKSSDDSISAGLIGAVKRETSSALSKSEGYFMDVFLQNLITRFVDERIPERERLIELDDQEGLKKEPPVSPSILAGNMKKLAGKFESIFEIQDSLIRILAWRNPSQTILVMICLTTILLYPISIIFGALVFFTCNVILSGYARRHPFRESYYPIRKRYGRSLINECLGGPSKKKGRLLLAPKSKVSQKLDQAGPEMEMMGDKFEEEELLELTSGMKLVIQLRDVQNITTGVVKLSDTAEKFLKLSGGFVDEKISTLFFYQSILALFALKLVLPQINWILMTVGAVWLIMFAMHPRIRPHTMDLICFIKKMVISDAMRRSDNHTRFDGEFPLSFIMDEAPETKLVEVFEIHQFDSLKNLWKFYKFSKQVFDPSDKYRKAKTTPPGSHSLADINPPHGWIFDENFAWEIDYEVEKWTLERGIELPTENEFLCDPQFKRRRLVRKVLRDLTMTV